MKRQQDLEKQNTKDPRLILLQSREEFRQKIQDERSEWVSQLDLENKKAIIFELEMLLMGLERFFQETKYSEAEQNHLLSRDFSKEMSIVLESVQKIIKISNRLLNQVDPLLPFRQFISDRSKDERNIQKEIDQDTPNDSLFFLNTSLKSFAVIIESLSRQERIPFLVFENLGILINREFEKNKYFNPDQFAKFTPFYDRINSEIVQKFIKSLKSDPIRKVNSVILLVFFRVLNYLRFIQGSLSKQLLMKKSVIIFSLISNEFKKLSSFIIHSINQIEEDLAEHQDEQLTEMLDTLIRIQKRVQNEYKKIFESELNNSAKSGEKISFFDLNLETCFFVLFHTCRHSIVDLVRVFDPQLNGKDIFPDYVSTFQQSNRLRNDLYLFEKVLNEFEKVTKTTEKKSVAPIYRLLIEFALYFQSVEFQSLRLDEYHEFKKFTAEVFLLSEKIQMKTMKDFDVDRFKRFIYGFKFFVNNTLKEVHKRAELRGHDMDTAKLEKTFEIYKDRLTPPGAPG